MFSNFIHVQLSRQLCSSWNETKRYLFLFDGMTSHTDNNTAKKCCISQSKSVSRYMSCYLMFSSTLHCTKFAKVFKVSWKFVNHANLPIKATIKRQRMSYKMERKIWCFPAYAQEIKEIDSNMKVSWNNWWKESGDIYWTLMFQKLCVLIMWHPLPPMNQE